MDWANGRLIHELAHIYGNGFSVAIFSDPQHNANYNYAIQVNKIYPLPFPFSYKGGIKNILKIRKIIGQLAKENDVLIVQLPFIGFPAWLGIKKPMVFHVCANVLTAAQNPFKYKGLARLASKSFAQFIHQVNKSLFKRKQSRLIVNGNELAEVYRAFNPVPVVSSSIYLAEMISESDVNTRSADEEFKMLFIGRPSKEKGFHTLIDAFTMLVDAGKPVTLKLLGVRRAETEAILGKPIENTYLDKIDFLGFISWGAQFREIVKSSHCLIVSSVSEGTPRVLIEARALGCPVIATNIGGIVTSVNHNVNGVLVNPGKPEEIKAAVETLFDEELRMKLAINGLRTAKRFTLEAFVRTFTDTVKSLG